MLDKKERRLARVSRRFPPGEYHNQHRSPFINRPTTMAGNAVSDSYSFPIETIKELPVIASQDQEFWLAAATSCQQIIDWEARTESSAAG